MMMKSVFYFIAMLGLVGAECPDVKLAFTGDTCTLPEDFNDAFEPIFTAMLEFLSYQEKNNGKAPTDNLGALLGRSSEALQSETYDNDSTVVQFTSRGYSAVKGNQGRFLADMERGVASPHERELYNCPSGGCSPGQWCCWFCPCNRRLNDVNPISNTKAIAPDAANGERSLKEKDVCAWLNDQSGDFTGCLAGAVFTCTYED